MDEVDKSRDHRSRDLGVTQVDDDEFNNNKDKICLLLIKMRLVGYMLNHMLDYIIISLMTTMLY